jgi:iron-sulfur cluster assembly protein
MAIELTQAAANHVAQEMAKRGRGEGLRVSTKKSGCSGFAYLVDYADDIGSADHVYESHGIKVVVDEGAFAQLDGMVIDFVKTNLLNEGFEFRNPNVKEMCGCGESFSV